MAEPDERSERVREEVDPQSGDPGVEEVDDIAREGMLVGKVDDVAGRLTRRMTADSDPKGRQGTDVEPQRGPAVHESGRGETLTLDSDTERSVRLGDELVVRLPEQDAAQGWTYELEGEDDRILDISERAEVVAQGAQHRHAPATGGCFQFVLHATGQGSATVRFQRLGPDAEVGRHIRLSVEIG